MKLLSRLHGEDRTPLNVGLTILAVNLVLFGTFLVLMAAIMLLGLVNVHIPPWVAILGVGAGSLGLWFYLGMSIPRSFSFTSVCVSVVVGISPIAFVTAAELAFLIVDPEGCVGAHILLLILGSVSLVLMAAVTFGGVVFRRILKPS